MTTSPTTARRFMRAGRRGVEHDLAAPLPTTLATIPEVRERSDQHSLVAARLAELRAKRIELARDLTASEANDLDQAAQAAAVGKAPPRRQKTASIVKAIEEVETEIHGFEIGVGRSADGLLAVAADHFEQAIALTREGEEEAIVRAGELLAATRAALTEAQTFGAERAWLLTASETARVEPFRPGSSGDLVRLATDLGTTFGQAIETWADRRTEIEQERDRQERGRSEQERKEEAARREDEQSRVVTEGMRVVSRGGKRVRQTGFGIAEIPEEEIPTPGFQDAEEERT